MTFSSRVKTTIFFFILLAHEGMLNLAVILKITCKLALIPSFVTEDFTSPTKMGR